MLLSLLNAGIMKWTKRCTTLTTLALPIIEWWIVWFVFYCGSGVVWIVVGRQ